ncbi:galectin-4 [Sorex araneus]|uniref:galectin-4 n=1 Tax=Sorex araneus TaxID=42254 RepID=UPI002433B042|nr:galectin-4 [Sorex araneus]
MVFMPAPGYHPCYNPTLPFCQPIPCALNVGSSIYLQGMACNDMTRFAVNFALGPEPGADIAFQLNHLFDNLVKVVFNSLLSGQWCEVQEERRTLFQRGEHFELLVMVMQEHYKVLVNGSLFYEYEHQIPFQEVTHLIVDGDVTLQSINFFANGPPYLGVPMPPMEFYAMEAPPVFNPPVPYMRRLQGGLMTRRTIIIRGFIPCPAYSFEINFCVGTTGDIALHIKSRMKECVVVRNTFQRGCWGPEESCIPFNPFVPGQYFDLSIRASTYKFKVFANGQHIFDYSHRMLATMVDILEICGDVVLSYVQV